MQDGGVADRRWIGGRGWDLALVFGGAPLAVVAGALALARPDLIVALWLGWLVFVDGPHLFATATRTYLDARARRQRRSLLITSLLWLLPGFVALGARDLLGIGAAWDAFLVFALFWGVHHNTRQHYGILSIYLRHGRVTPAARRRHVVFLYVASWVPFAIFTLGHLTAVPTALPLAFFGALTLAYALAGAREAVNDWRPLAYVLGPVTAVGLFSYFVVGARPLLPGAPDPEGAFLAVGFVGGMVHGLQYLGVVFAANRRRDGGSYPTLAAYGVMVVLSVGYAALNLARGITPENAALVAPGTAARAFLAFYWGLFFHHYYVDQKIWRPHADPAVRSELGLS